MSTRRTVFAPLALALPNGQRRRDYCKERSDNHLRMSGLPSYDTVKPNRAILGVLTGLLLAPTGPLWDVERGLSPECANVRSRHPPERRPRRPLRHRA